MSGLQAHVDDYLRLRRALGFKLERHGQILPQLVAFLEAAGERTVTSDLAIAWARLPAGAHPRHWAARLAIARGFAAYLQTIDPTTEIPPAGVFAVRYQRPTPYLWSQHEICRLLESARTLRPPLKAASYEALFGLLAVSGMRVGEAMPSSSTTSTSSAGWSRSVSRSPSSSGPGSCRYTPAPSTRSSAMPLRERGCARGPRRARSSSRALARG
jgi:site-specific recombinase XerC